MIAHVGLYLAASVICSNINIVSFEVFIAT
jgi:hypothetical protein